MQNTEFKPFMARQIEDGKWECYHHAVHELTATGRTEAEALQNALTLCESVIDKNHDALTRWHDRAKAAEKTLERARALLAVHAHAVEYAKKKGAHFIRDGMSMQSKLAYALFDVLHALGGGE